MPSEVALAVEGLCAGYGGGDILHHVSFTVPDGGITCIVGPNGSGEPARASSGWSSSPGASCSTRP